MTASSDDARAGPDRGDDQREAMTHLIELAITLQEEQEAAAHALDAAEAKARELEVHAKLHELFVGILGHDLRNPLASITWSADALTRSALGMADQGHARRINRNAVRMGRMIEQLLDLTRTRLGGGIPLTRIDVDLGAVVHQVVDELPPPSARLTVTGDLRGSWDADRVAEAVSNIVSNAIEYATAGTAVAIEARRDGDDALIAVRNSGPAIPAELLPVLFQPFRGSQGTRRPRAGDHLGLGLYIADQIVRAHGGTLAVTSGFGLTTFVIRMPITAAVAP